MILHDLMTEIIFVLVVGDFVAKVLVVGEMKLDKWLDNRKTRGDE